MTTIILAVAIMGIAFAGFAVRLFFIKDADVRGGCAGKNPLLNEEGVTCTVCGRTPTTEGCGEDV
ncbi:MAG: membrane or secreted protein [Bacteroidetes bacterium]|nr:membrane or secreted protein [Bacteroidota bacterium]